MLNIVTIFSRDDEDVLVGINPGSRLFTENKFAMSLEDKYTGTSIFTLV